MQLEQVIKKRRTIRKFKDKPVSKKLVRKIINAGRHAPSGLNQQPWKFIVIDTKDIKSKIRKIYEKSREEMGIYKQDTSFVENATIIVCLGDKKKIAYLTSVALAIENILLQATALRLGCFIGTTFFGTKKAEKEIRRLLKISSYLEIIALVLVGYPDEKPKKKTLKKLGEIIHFNSL